MDRRLFLTGLIGIAGAAAVAGATREARAVAAISRNGILDEIDAPQVLARLRADGADAALLSPL